MQGVDEKKETATFRAKSRDETGMKRVEKKLIDKGVHRKDRHPVDGQPLDRQRKAGHGGKYTWEGPADAAAYELEDSPAVLDEKDPNYVDGEAEGRILRGEVSGVEGMVVGEIDVAKMAAEGVARVDVHPRLQPNV